MKQLTRQQLQNDLDAARKHRVQVEEAYTNEYQLRRATEAQVAGLHNVIDNMAAERDDWRAAFKTISKLVK